MRGADSGRVRHGAGWRCASTSRSTPSTGRAGALRLGSINTGIGHSESAWGVAALVETVECPRRGTVRPNQNFQAWNPDIDRDEKSRLSVPTEPSPWPVPDIGRLVAVCSYGVSGAKVMSHDVV